MVQNRDTPHQLKMGQCGIFSYTMKQKDESGKSKRKDKEENDLFPLPSSKARRGS